MPTINTPYVHAIPSIPTGAFSHGPHPQFPSRVFGIQAYNATSTGPKETLSETLEEIKKVDDTIGMHNSLSHWLARSYQVQILV